MVDFVEISLLSERLTLKRICPELHVVEINAAVTDSFDSLVQWLPWSINPPTIEETLKALIRVAADPHYAFRIYLNQSQQLIGQCGIKLISEADSVKKTYEIGYWLHKNFTGKGYMHEAVLCLLNFSVTKLMAERFIICCDEKNIKSQNVALKCGFKLIKKIELTFDARPDWGLCTDFVFEKVV
ncbi:ribosomal-protein-serine acetyltransferase isoform X2 [Hydra vulgaris]|uniref:Ribosomal-protein-serine acetyltransferase isoform X2 n=1 Tax=Hydra vulgaris TaxID=6087 RepID=A0ABM4BKA5_HYDVU